MIEAKLVSRSDPKSGLVFADWITGPIIDLKGVRVNEDLAIGDSRSYHAVIADDANLNLIFDGHKATANDFCFINYDKNKRSILSYNISDYLETVNKDNQVIQPVDPEFMEARVYTAVLVYDVLNLLAQTDLIDQYKARGLAGTYYVLASLNRNADHDDAKQVGSVIF